MTINDEENISANDHDLFVMFPFDFLIILITVNS